MPGENIKTAKRLIAALNRGDLDSVIEELSDDFVFDFSRSISPERGVYRREDLPRFVEAFAGLWESVRYEVDEFIEVGDRIVTPLRTHNRGRDGIELHTRAAWLWSFHGGRPARITFFQSRSDGIDAAGIPD